MLQIIETKPQKAQKNMDFDALLLDRLDPQAKPILHLYEWKYPSVTYGYFIDKDRFFDLQALHREKLDLARRPTGGGIVFHLWDFAFSVLIGSLHPFFSHSVFDTYQFINRIVMNGIQSFVGNSAHLIFEDQKTRNISSHFCMARPTKYDVGFNGKKIVGAAQRKKKNGLLHQGTISLFSIDPAFLSKVLLPNNTVIEAISSFTYPLFPEAKTKNDQIEIKEEIKNLLTKEMQQHFS